MPSADPDFAAYRRLLHEQDWRKLSKKMMTCAFRVGRLYAPGWNLADAEDATHDVLRRLFEPSTLPRWNPAKQPSLYRFLYGRLTRQVKVACARGMRFPPHTEEALDEARRVDPSGAENEIARAQMWSRRMARLKELCVDDPDALLVIACREEGFDDIQETAERAGLTWQKTRNALLRIEGKAAQVRREIPSGEEAKPSEEVRRD
jgi:hypothetical protein